MTSCCFQTPRRRGARFCLPITCMLAIVVALIATPTLANDARTAVNVTVQENAPDHIVIQYDIAGFGTKPVMINGREYVQISLGTESLIKNRGAPALPSICRCVIIPDDAEMAVRVAASRHYELTDIDVAPDKGYIPRSKDPADVPYTFGQVYETDTFYPDGLVTPHEPHIIRDHRGLLIQLNPLQYNAVSRTLRVYTSVTLEVVRIGRGKANVLNLATRPHKLSRAFHQVYKRHFLNYDLDTRYDPIDEDGDMLIICYDDWMANMSPFVDHKNAIGINTTIVGVSTIPGGNTPTAIKNYIQGVYDDPGSDLAFVLLVGDAAQVATPIADLDYYDGASDPTYSLLAGADQYPEIMVGRFSAQNTAHVDTQVVRSVEYEQMPANEQTWFWKGTGIGSNSAGTGDDGEYDWQHIRNIRADLLGYDYTEVDELYDGSHGGADAAGDPTPAMVAACLNAGRGIVNYCGHGSYSSWSSSDFSTTNINNLINDNMLPFIVSVACNNGEFNNYSSCFGEAWLRATHGSEPTGAVGCYASSNSQPWDPPMEGQDEFNLRYAAEAYSTYGAFCYAGSCSMMDDYPGSSASWGTGPATFLTWNLFGDPSLQIVGTVTQPTGLKVTPGSGLASAGPVGGPFTPDDVEYTLENQNDTGMNYSVTKSEAWVSIDNTSGYLPGHGTTTVTVSINANASALGTGNYEDTVNFINTTDHDGDTTRTVNLQVGGPQAVYAFPMDSNPGWTTQGEWAFGDPTGSGGTAHGNADPDSGATGSNVYGVNLSGDYSTTIGGPYYLQTGPMDLTGIEDVTLKFHRWLNTDYVPYVSLKIEASNNGTTWDVVWQNATAEIADSSWTQYSYDISIVADDQPTVYIRWSHQVAQSGAYAYSGWNIDDVEIWGLVVDPCAGVMANGDIDGDGYCDGDDIQLLVNGILGSIPQEQECRGDFNHSGALDTGDIDGMVSALLAP
ncbi:MAG: hypothetical protein JXQ75_20850 [Phycisphaerae bacterium]|nr:hypothetical protein [Phycisphaerae bacterium]